MSQCEVSVPKLLLIVKLSRKLHGPNLLPFCVLTISKIHRIMYHFIELNPVEMGSDQQVYVLLSVLVKKILVFRLGRKKICSRTQLRGKLQGWRLSDFPAYQIEKSSSRVCLEEKTSPLSPMREHSIFCSPTVDRESHSAQLNSLSKTRLVIMSTMILYHGGHRQVALGNDW